MKEMTLSILMFLCKNTKSMKMLLFSLQGDLFSMSPHIFLCLLHRECERENQAALEDPFAQSHASTNNFKLGEGEKIKVKIAGKTGQGRTRPAGGSSGGLLAPPKEKHFTSGGGLLAPPPERNSNKQAITSANTKTSSNSVFGFDSTFSDSLTESSSNQQKQQSTRYSFLYFTL